MLQEADGLEVPWLAPARAVVQAPIDEQYRLGQKRTRWVDQIREKSFEAEIGDALRLESAYLLRLGVKFLLRYRRDL